jgi:hypothetical protein
MYLTTLLQRMIAVSVAVLALIAWVVIIVFAVIPKGLTLTEIVFLYFFITIMTITLFTILDVNLRWATVTRDVEGAFAMYICRFIVIPFEILISVSVIRSRLKAIWRWVFTSTILLSLCLFDRVYLWADLLNYQHWNEFYSALMYEAFMVLVWWIARWFIGLDKEDANHREHRSI